MRPALPIRYEICIKDHLALHHSEWFGLMLRQDFCCGQAVTVLTGSLPDQAALYGVLNKVQALGLNLLTLKQLEPEP